MLAVARARAQSQAAALSLTDTGSFSVSESTCYRLLKRHGLVKPAEVVGFAAEKEYRRKTERPNQMWATDGAYLKVAGWGYYYLVTVLDDYSRYILAWRLQQDMTASSLVEVVQEAVKRTGMTEVPLVTARRCSRTTGPATSRGSSPATYASILALPWTPPKRLTKTAPRCEHMSSPPSGAQ